jgi:hypothetical protein
MDNIIRSVNDDAFLVPRRTAMALPPLGLFEAKLGSYLLAEMTAVCLLVLSSAFFALWSTPAVVVVVTPATKPQSRREPIVLVAQSLWMSLCMDLR